MENNMNDILDAMLFSGSDKMVSLTEIALVLGVVNPKLILDNWLTDNVNINDEPKALAILLAIEYLKDYDSKKMSVKEFYKRLGDKPVTIENYITVTKSKIIKRFPNNDVIAIPSVALTFAQDKSASYHVHTISQIVKHMDKEGVSVKEFFTPKSTDT